MTPPTGNSAAIAFYRQQATLYTGVAGVTIVESGYFFLRPGAHKSVDYSWGSKPPAGYVPAKATISASLSDGKIIAYLGTLKAPGVRPLRIVMAGGAVFTSTSSCWTRSTPSASPLGTGERFVFNDGGAHFASRAGNAVTFTYRWAPGAIATETNSFTAAEPASVDVLIKVAGKRPLTIRESIVPLPQAPPLPMPSPPARPAPSPICS